MRFFSILITSSLFLFSVALKAQNQPSFVNVPAGLRSISIAGPVFIGTDSSGNKGLIGKNGKWLGNRRFSEQLLGPVASIFFGIGNPAQQGKSQKQPVYNQFPWISVLPQELAERQLYVYRLDTLGKILDSFRLSASHVELADAGLKCSPNFPERQLYLLPAIGKPVQINMEMDVYGSYRKMGVPDEISYFGQVDIFRDFFRKSAFPEYLKRQEKPENGRKIYEDFESSGICKSISGFSFHYLYPGLPVDLVVYENKKNPRYWTGRKLCFEPALSESDKPALWIQHKDGVLCFTENQVSSLIPQIFLATIDSASHKLPIIYTGQSGDYRAYSTNLLKNGILPEKTSFLFSYSGLSWEENGTDYPKTNETARPEYSLFYRVRDAFLKEIRENNNDIWVFNRTLTTRPALVFEKNGRLVALDVKGREFFLPPVKDTVEFLSRLRFLYDESKKQNIPFWNAFNEGREGIPTILKEGEPCPGMSSDCQPELLAVPSICIPAEFRSAGATSGLYIHNGNLYSEKGLRFPISGRIVSVLGTWNQRLLMQISADKKSEIRDANNQLLFSGVFSSLSETGSGWLQAFDVKNKTFLILPDKGKLKKGKAYNALQPLRNLVTSEPVNVIYKGNFAKPVRRLFRSEPKDALFLTGYNSETDFDGEGYEQLVDGLDQIIMQGPLTTENHESGSLLKSKTAKRQFPLPCETPIDSVVAAGKKRAWLFLDAYGFYTRLKGKNQRLSAQKVCIPKGGKIAYYQVVFGSHGNDDPALIESGGWKSIDENGKIAKYHFNPVSLEEIKGLNYTYDTRLFRFKADLLCRVAFPEKQPLMFFPASGKTIHLPKHPDLKFACLLPDSMRPDKQQKWLVMPALIGSGSVNFQQWAENGIVANDEALALISSEKKWSKEEFQQLMSTVTPLDDQFRPVVENHLVPLVILGKHTEMSHLPTLMRSPAGLLIHFRDKDKNLLPDYANPGDYFSDPSSGSYAIRRKNGQFELFDHAGSLGEFRRLRTSVSTSFSDVWYRVLMAEKENGEIVGFYPDGRKMVIFRPEAYLQKAFPHLPAFRAGTYPEFQNPDSALIILPDLKTRNVPFGYYIGDSRLTGKDKNLYRLKELSGKLLNPFGLSEKEIIQSLQGETPATGHRLQEIRANGNSRTLNISPPAGYRLFSNEIVISKAEKDTYSVFMKLDTVGGNSKKKSWLYEAISGRIYSFSGTSNLNFLYPDQITQFTNLNPRDYYLFVNNTPVQLSTISDDIGGFRETDGQLNAVLNPWSGFIDKKGRQKISISCEGGSCSGEVVQFRSGFAALKKGDELTYIDTTGKNPFKLKFACASDFVGNYAIVFNPDSIQNGSNLEYPPDQRPEDEPYAPADEALENPRVDMEGMDTHANEAAAVDSAGPDNDGSYYWLHKSGRLISLNPYKYNAEQRAETFLSLEHNGAFTILTEYRPTIHTIDTSGKVRGVLEGHSLYSDADSYYNSNKFLKDQPLISQGLFRVKNPNKKVGFCNIEGKLVIPCRFQSASSFSNGIAAVTEQGEKDAIRSFYIDLKGKELFPNLEFTETNPFSEGIASAVLKNKGWILLDSNGKILEANPDNQFLAEIRFKDGMASFLGSTSNNESPQSQLGYLDRSGKTAIFPQFQQGPADFTEGIAWVADKDGKSFFIDKTGKRIPDLPEVSRCGRFSEGLCHVFLPEIQRPFDVKSGEFLKYSKAISEPIGFEWLRLKGFNLVQKSAAYSVWNKYNEKGGLDFRILKH